MDVSSRSWKEVHWISCEGGLDRRSRSSEVSYNISVPTVKTAGSWP